MTEFVYVAVFVAIMLTAYCAARLAAGAQCFHELRTRSNRYGALDGIRGYLAFSVFVHHFVITWHWKVHGIWESPAISSVYNFGLVAVYLFFMITGFLFVYKLLDARRAVSWRRLYISRVFRIYPLYLIVLIAIFSIVAWHTGATLNVPLSQLLKEVVKWLLYLGTPINDFQNTSMIIAGVYWTLKYEWLFYLSLPLIFFLLRFSWLGFAILIGLPLYAYFWPVDLHYFESKYFVLFLAGGIAAAIHRRIQAMNWNFNNLYANLLTVALIISVFSYPNDLDVVHIALMFLTFVMISNGNSLLGVLTATPSLVLGEISYSIYLLHGLVLYIAFTLFELVNVAQLNEASFLLWAPATAAVIVAVCYLSYALIEKPAMALGKRLAN